MMMPYSCKQVICFDLDDTLYKEADFLKSAFGEVAIRLAEKEGLNSEAVHTTMMTAWAAGKSPFQEVKTMFYTGTSVEECLKIYRAHKPSVSLDIETQNTLKVLHEHNCALGLITDGRSITQRNKIEALGLYRYIQEDDILISEEFGSEKPAERNFLYFMERYPDAEFTYIGDNIRKDFIAPKKLGWKTVCLLDDGSNIHKQDFSQPEEYLPDFSVRKMEEVVRITLQ